MEPQRKQPVLTLPDDRLLEREMEDTPKKKRKKNSLILFCHPFFESFFGI